MSNTAKTAEAIIFISTPLACGRPGTISEPTTVTAERVPAAVCMTLSHAACAPSRVRYIQVGRLPTGIARMRCLPAVLDCDSSAHLRALLILDPAVQLFARMLSGEHLDPATSCLVGLGFTLLRDVDQKLAPARGWDLRLA